ncbi:MAG TPA: class I SAM-dependent methyltransferase [bacterium]|nr:class I SAM-dependent methyltransferase [bacterium]
MDELAELVKKYGSNKLKEGYMPIYEFYVNKWKDKEINLMEIGVSSGASIEMWHEYFKKANIYGIDIRPETKFEKERIEIYIGDQTDEEFLKGVCKDKQFDIIIDDGGHKMSQQIGSFKILWEYLKSGGLYVIEDLHTSYYNKFLDLDHTTMDFLLTKLNDLNLSGKREYTIDDLNEYEKTIEFIHFYKSIVFIKKR